MKSVYDLLFTSANNGDFVPTHEGHVKMEVENPQVRWSKIGKELFHVKEYSIGNWYSFIEMKLRRKISGVSYLSNGAIGSEYYLSAEGADGCRRRLGIKI